MNSVQNWMAELHSNGQQRIERDRDTQKGCQKPAVQQKTTDDDDEVSISFWSGLTGLNGMDWTDKRSDEW